VSESSIHIKLKENATRILRRKGFEKVEFEKTMSIGNRQLRVDVFAAHDGKRVVVECGATTNSKIKQLRKVVDEVTVLRPIDVIEFLEEELTEREKKVSELQMLNNELQKRLQKIEKQLFEVEPSKKHQLWFCPLKGFKLYCPYSKSISYLNFHETLPQRRARI
jgi:Holliday junction resolvase